MEKHSRVFLGSLLLFAWAYLTHWKGRQDPLFYVVFLISWCLRLQLRLNSNHKYIS